ncbi:MAG: ribonuclease H family protein [Porticoccaceae bacterium]
MGDARPAARAAGKRDNPPCSAAPAAKPSGWIRWRAPFESSPWAPCRAERFHSFLLKVIAVPPKKYYVVWVGKVPGIYTSWPVAERQIKGFPGAKFKSFPTLALAEEAYALGKPATVRKPASPRAKVAATGERSIAAIEIYCDGACDPNPGKAGTGIAVYKNSALDALWYGLYNPAGTNNMAELLGLQHSLVFAKRWIESGQTVAILCDSKYAIECVTTWAFGWKANGWKRKGGEIMNLDLIRSAHALYVEIADRIRVLHVAGHAGIEGNELADRMSVVAITRKESALRQYTETLSTAQILAMPKG